MKNVFLPIYYNWAEITESLSAEEFGHLVRALLQYARGEERREELSAVSAMAYAFMCEALDRNEQARALGQKGAEIKAKRAMARGGETAGFGAEKRVAETSNLSDKSGDNLSDYMTEEQRREASDLQTEKDEDGDLYGKNARETAFVRRSSPTKEEIIAFFKERSYTSSAEDFYNYYEANGWIIGRNPIVNWRAAAEAWESRSKSEFIRRQPPPKKQEKKAKHGHIDVNEAFRIAVERSFSDLDEEL